MKNLSVFSKNMLLFLLFLLFMSSFLYASETTGLIEAIPAEYGDLDVVENKVSTDTAPLKDFEIPNNYKFILVTLGAGGIAGWAVGFTLKKIAKVLALVLGVVFISLQVLAFKNLIVIDWVKIEGLYANNTELEGTLAKAMSVVTYNLPFVGSFMVGFWMGFKKG